MPRFDTAKEAKAAGQFSRRHRTRDAHDEAVATYQSKSGKEPRRIRAAERQAIIAKRLKAERDRLKAERAARDEASEKADA